jgi:hypothetical protein
VVAQTDLSYVVCAAAQARETYTKFVDRMRAAYLPGVYMSSVLHNTEAQPQSLNSTVLFRL